MAAPSTSAPRLKPNAASPTTSPRAPFTTRSSPPPTSARRRLRAMRPIVNSRPRKKSRNTSPISATKSVTSDGSMMLSALGSCGPSSKPPSRYAGIAESPTLPATRPSPASRATVTESCAGVTRADRTGAESRPSGSAEPRFERHARREDVEVALVPQRLRRLGQGFHGDPREPAADAHPLRARVGHFAEGEPRPGQHVHGLRDRLADGVDVVDRAQARRVEHVRARPLVRLQAGDRVAQVRAAPDQVLRPRGEHEGEAEGLCPLRGRFDALDGVRELVDPPLGIVVLDRAADGPGLRGAANRARRRLGLGSVAVLEVYGHG